MHRVPQWIEEHNPDVICIQETKLKDTAFPHEDFTALGYESAHHGFNQWNGVAILSRVGLDGVEFGFGGEFDNRDEGRVISATCDGIRVSSVYVPNGRSLDDPHYQWKLDWLDELASVVEKHADEQIAICGDFNVAPEDRDVWDITKFKNRTHVSEPERERIRALTDAGLVDTLRACNPDAEELFTWWDYRMGSFHRGWGMRLDHILLSTSLAERATAAFVDREARKGEKPSDHAPVTVRLSI